MDISAIDKNTLGVDRIYERKQLCVNGASAQDFDLWGPIQPGLENFQGGGQPLFCKGA
jgi:hypothetical protein